MPPKRQVEYTVDVKVSGESSLKGVADAEALVGSRAKSSAADAIALGAALTKASKPEGKFGADLIDGITVGLPKATASLDPFINKIRQAQQELEAAKSHVDGLFERELKGAAKIEAERTRALSKYGVNDHIRHRLNEFYDDKAKEARHEEHLSFTEKVQGTVEDFAQHPFNAAGRRISAAAEAIGPLGTTIVAGTAAAGIGLAELGKHLFELVEHSGEAAEATAHLATSLGLTLHQASELSAEARIVGIDIGGITASARLLSVALEDASGAGKKASDALTSLKVSRVDPNTGEIRELGPILEDTLDKLSAVEEKTQRTLLATRLLGREGSKALAELIERHKELKKTVNELGFAQSDDLIAHLQHGQEEINKMRLATDLLKAEFAKLAEPVVISFVGDFTKLVGGGKHAIATAIALAARYADTASGDIFGGLPDTFTSDSVYEKLYGKDKPEEKNKPRTYTKAEEAAFAKARNIAASASTNDSGTPEGIQTQIANKQSELKKVQSDLTVFSQPNERPLLAKVTEAKAQRDKLVQDIEGLKRNLKALEAAPQIREELEKRLESDREKLFSLQNPSARFGQIPQVLNEQKSFDFDLTHSEKTKGNRRLQNEFRASREPVFQAELQAAAEDLGQHFHEKQFRLSSVEDKGTLDSLKRRFELEEKLAKLQSDPDDAVRAIELITEAYQHQLEIAQKLYESDLKRAQTLDKKDPQRKLAITQAAASFTELSNTAANELTVGTKTVERQDRLSKDRADKEIGKLQSDTALDALTRQIDLQQHLATLGNEGIQTPDTLATGLTAQLVIAQAIYDQHLKDNAQILRGNELRVANEKAFQELTKQTDDARYDAAKRYLELQQQGNQQAKHAGAELFQSLRNDPLGPGHGAGEFFKAQGNKVLENLFSNATAPVFRQAGQFLNSSFPNSGIFKDIFKGTAFEDPTSATKENTDAIKQLTDAITGKAGSVSAVPGYQDRSEAPAHDLGFKDLFSFFHRHRVIDAATLPIRVPETTLPNVDVDTTPVADTLLPSLDKGHGKIDALTHKVAQHLANQANRITPPVPEPVVSNGPDPVVTELRRVQKTIEVGTPDGSTPPRYGTQNAPGARDKEVLTPLPSGLIQRTPANVPISEFRPPFSPHGFAIAGEVASNDGTAAESLLDNFKKKASVAKSLAGSAFDGFMGTWDISSGPPLIPRYAFQIPAEERAKAAEAFKKGNYGQAAGHAVASIPGTGFISDLYGAQVDLASRGLSEIQGGHPIVGGIHTLMSGLPLVGPNTVAISDELLNPDPNTKAHAVGELLGYGVAGTLPFAGLTKAAALAKAHPLVTAAAETAERAKAKVQDAKTAIQDHLQNQIDTLLDEEGSIGPGSGRKRARAVASYKPSTQAKQLLADQSEAELSKALGIPRTSGNAPFDLQDDHLGIEIKTLVDNDHDKITMHKESLARKLQAADENQLHPYTIAVDKRGAKPSYYFRDGLGSFRIPSMTPVKSLGALKRMLMDETGSVGPGAGYQPHPQPRIFNTPDDITTFKSWGETRTAWKDKETGQPSGRLLTGEPLDRVTLPEYLYHVTTNAKGVLDTGVLLGQKSDAGLGGGQAPGVSFTTDATDARVIQRDLARSVRIARGDVGIDALSDFAKQDEAEAGIPAGTLADAAQQAQDWYAFNAKGPVYRDNPTKLRSLTKDAFNSYLWPRDRAANTYNAPVLKNPILFGDQEKLASVDPDQVQTLRVPSKNIPKDALVTTGSDAFLHEVRAYSDVPVNDTEVESRGLGAALKRMLLDETGSFGPGSFGSGTWKLAPEPTGEIMYRGAPNADLGKGSFPGTFLSTDRNTAAQYGPVHSFRVAANKFLDIDDHRAEPLSREYLSKHPDDAPNYDPELEDGAASDLWMFPTPGWKRFLQAREYDGTSIGKDRFVFDPEKIKPVANETPGLPSAIKRVLTDETGSFGPGSGRAQQPRDYTTPLASVDASGAASGLSTENALAAFAGLLPQLPLLPAQADAKSPEATDKNTQALSDLTAVLLRASSSAAAGPGTSSASSGVSPQSAIDDVIQGSLPPAPQYPSRDTAQETHPAAPQAQRRPSPTPLTVASQAASTFSSFHPALGPASNILGNVQQLRNLFHARSATHQTAQAFHNLPVNEHVPLTLPNLDEFQTPQQQAGLVSPSGFATLPQSFASIGDVANQSGILSNAYSDAPATPGLAGQFGGLPGAPAFADAKPKASFDPASLDALPEAPAFDSDSRPSSVSTSGIPTFHTDVTEALPTLPPEQLPTPDLYSYQPTQSESGPSSYTASGIPVFSAEGRGFQSQDNFGEGGLPQPLPQSVLDAANPFNSPLTSLTTINKGLEGLYAGFAASGLGTGGGEGGSSSEDSDSGSGSTSSGSSAKSGLQHAGKLIGQAATLTAGTLGAIAGFKKGGAKGDLEGITSVLGTAAALDPEPISKAILGISAGVTAMINAFLPDPRAQRQKQLAREIQNARLAAEPYTQNGVSITESTSGHLLNDNFLGGINDTHQRPDIYTINQAIGFDALHSDRIVTQPFRKVGGGAFTGGAPAPYSYDNDVSSPLPRVPGAGSLADLSPALNSSVNNQSTPSIIINNHLPVHGIDSKDIISRANDFADALSIALQAQHRVAADIRFITNPV